MKLSEFDNTANLVKRYREINHIWHVANNPSTKHMKVKVGNTSLVLDVEVIKKAVNEYKVDLEKRLTEAGIEIYNANKD